MTSGKVAETHRTNQNHTLDALSSSMALRYDGSDVGMVLLLHCFHAVSCFFSFPWRKTDSIHVRYLVLLMVGGYEETDLPMQ